MLLQNLLIVHRKYRVYFSNFFALPFFFYEMSTTSISFTIYLPELPIYSKFQNKVNEYNNKKI